MFPIRQAPLDGEITSSWVVRNALALGLTGRQLASTIPRGNHYWSGDPDIGPAHPFLDDLAEKTMNDRTAIVRTTITDLLGTLDSSCAPRMWKLHRRKSHNSHSFGLQFCGRCLGADERPYYRRWWKLSLAVCCPVHRALLSDECPECTASVCLEDIPASGCRTSSHLIARCYNCGFDLRRTPSPLETRFDDSALHSFQLFHSRWLHQGFVDRPDLGVLSHYLLYFQMLWHLVSRLYRATSTRNRWLSETVSRELGLPSNRLGHSRKAFGSMSNYERRLPLLLAASLMEDWPARFIGLYRKAGLSRLDFDQIRTQLAWSARLRFIGDHSELRNEPLELDAALAEHGLHRPTAYIPSLALRWQRDPDLAAWMSFGARAKQSYRRANSPRRDI